MTHGHVGLKFSESEASKNSEAVKKRLLQTRKLSLVVDLDQTIIHAAFDPTIGEWKRDETNPNHAAVKDVESFQLKDENTHDPAGTCYYIKPRPGLPEFLEEVSKKYEMHIYTMATRAYAQEVAKIIDPKGVYFGDRIMSRDESGSMSHKFLNRIFPIDTKLVVIIDDRADVWSWSPNLVKVNPYGFFVGIGDINSSFLPDRTDLTKPPLLSAPTETPEFERTSVAINTNVDSTNGTISTSLDSTEDSEISVIEKQLVAMAGGDDPSVLQEKVQKQEETIVTQLTERPLLKKQEILDKRDEEDASKEQQQNGEGGEIAEADTTPHKHRHSLLHDNDEELIYLQHSLEKVHKSYFDEYDRRVAGSHGGRVAMLRGEKATKVRPEDELHIVPDIKDIMPPIKVSVLKGVVICFTGVVPQGVDPKLSDLGMWARSFGAVLSTNVTKSTTHVVAHKERRTHKVRVAAKHPRIKIVTPSWLTESFSRWRRVDERPHLIEVERDDHTTQDSLAFEELEDGVVLSESEDTGGEEGVSILPDDFEDEGADVAGQEEERSPIDCTDEQWMAMNDELQDFLDEDDTEDDNISVASEDLRDMPAEERQEYLKSRKRKREETDSAGASDAEDSDASVNGLTRLQRKKKRALERTTGLTNVAMAEKSSGLPSPDTTGPEEEEAQEEEDDELEAAILAGFEDDGENEDGPEQ
jgi:RNA polymerase II subunit A-like phosphatase